MRSPDPPSASSVAFAFPFEGNLNSEIGVLGTKYDALPPTTTVRVVDVDTRVFTAPVPGVVSPESAMSTMKRARQPRECMVRTQTGLRACSVIYAYPAHRLFLMRHLWYARKQRYGARSGPHMYV